jgi:hypothetical protein
MADLSDSTWTGTCTVNVLYVIELEWASRSTKLNQRQPGRDLTVDITNSSMINSILPKQLATWLATDYSIQRSHEASSSHTSQVSVILNSGRTRGGNP